VSALPHGPQQEWRAPEPAPAPEAPGRASGLVSAARTLVPMILLGVVPVALAAYFLAAVVPREALGLDFREAFWPAAHAVLHGNDPYPALDSPALAQRMAYAYPPVVAVVLAPFGLLPVGLATAIAMLATVAALVAALRVMGVRDWRCYGASLASPVVLVCIQTAALSAVLALAVALAWRHRAHGLATPLLIAAMIAAKLFLWPLLVWLAIVRGTRCALLTGLGAAGVIVAPWLAGFPGAREYLPLLSKLTELEGAYAYTPRSLALSLGAGSRLAETCAIAAGASVIVAAIAMRSRVDADRRTLALTLLAALLLSPIVWLHYLVVLLPLMALASRRLSPIWLVPCGLWLAAGGTWTGPSAIQITVSLVVMSVVVALVLRPHRRRLRAGGLAAAPTT
jgi:alpha-1,2-mannosyltransferase